MHMLLLDRMFLLCKKVFVQCAAIRISYNPEIPNLRKRKNHTFFLETSICIIIRYTCSSSACGSLMMHSIFKAFWFVVWRPPKDNTLETWKFQGGHLMYIYIYQQYWKLLSVFWCLPHVHKKILGTGTTNFVRVSDLWSEVCLLFMTVENETKHIYIYDVHAVCEIEIYRRRCLKSSDADVWNFGLKILKSRVKGVSCHCASESLKNHASALGLSWPPRDMWMTAFMSQD